MIKHCVICGKEFETHLCHKITCSKECSVEHHRRSNRITPRKAVGVACARFKNGVCYGCDKKFDQHFPTEKFCSDDCRLSYFDIDDRIVFFKLANGGRR